MTPTFLIDCTYMDQKTTGYGTMPMQGVDATICSNDSSNVNENSLVTNSAKKTGKIKAYVDFTEFNKNYEEYLEKNGLLELSDDSIGESGAKAAKTNHLDNVQMAIDGQNSSPPSQLSEDWEVISNTGKKSET